ncbi:elicitin-like protein [Phytophthora infestans T30-4]|uniref:Elicitin n=2 Tax=Phytophthora infestans TaxID=4787 RepID=D0N9K2_PHYIT|nr:elicitin-like protein [Phytophthora infestans T30-4]EEY54490.1 elicitin-like protein [Phytophthora infestans T30-4]KAF4033719.1 Elicitin [Phytophthora infestans]KAF4146084.1 Elicitin [Phytophthora infestans]|eukprot:XP_002904312.1 elicitin-like protein [Phytophthora infestans T30-4]
MLYLTTLLLVMSTILVKAENCSVHTIYAVLEPVASDPNFATCQTDSNYSLLSFENLSLNQTEGFCASSACQALLKATLTSGLLPHCDVVIGVHSLNLTDAVTIASKCSETLEERVVDEDEGEGTVGRIAGNIVDVVAHSIPMDELVLALLRV